MNDGSLSLLRCRLCRNKKYYLFLKAFGIDFRTYSTYVLRRVIDLRNDLQKIRRSKFKTIQ